MTAELTVEEWDKAEKEKQRAQGGYIAVGEKGKEFAEKLRKKVRDDRAARRQLPDIQG